ncbi:MAG: beta-ketoacyl-ACP synthase 3 [Nitrospirales bacterium]|nr:beta-ketoacyl-ACP synthase 3 [Nitrospirales bacterium]
MRTRIIGTGSYVPERVVDNAEICRPLLIDTQAVLRLTGIRSRHWAGAKQATSDLAEQAARRACESAGIDPASVEAVLLSTTSPDRTLPSTACVLQSRLGLRGAAAFDLAASCSGFLYGLSMADRFIRSGQFRRCLVVAAEIKSRFLNLSDEATAILFSDGAGAAVVQGEETSGVPSGVLGIHLYADGARHGLIGIPAGGSRRPTSPETIEHQEHVLRMQGGPLFRTAVKQLAGAVSDLLKEFGYGLDDVGLAIFHQANGRLLSALGKRLGLAPEKLFSVIDRIGNPSSASLPIALDVANREGRLRSGDLLLLGTFGGGLTWGTGLVRW